MLLYLYRSEIVVGTNSSSCSEVHADLCKYLLIIAPKEKGGGKSIWSNLKSEDVLCIQYMSVFPVDAY